MPRNSGGSYSLPNAPVVADTVIDPDWANSTLDDLAVEITDSLSRTGDGDMLAPIRVPDGSAALPSHSFKDQTTAGFWRAGSGDFRAAFNGTNIFKFSTAENRSYNALKVSAGGCTIDAGGLIVTSGGLSVAAGGAAVTGTMGATGTVAAAHTLEATGHTTTSGHTQPLTTLAKAQFGSPGNTGRLNVRTLNTGTVTGWGEVRLGLSYDVDSVVGSGGSFYLSQAGAVLTGGTTATGPDPTNALELTNGNLKLSGVAPNADEAVPNTLTPRTLTKARGRISTDGGGNTIVSTDAVNIASATIVSGGPTQVLRITFAAPFSSTDYTVVATGNGLSIGTGGFVPFIITQTTTYVDIRVLDQAGSAQVLTSTAVTVHMLSSGDQ